MPAGHTYAGGVGVWYLAIDPYIKNAQVRMCPSDGVSAVNTCSYGVPYNNIFTDTGAGPRGASLGNLTAPADTLIMGDSAGIAGPSTWYYYSLKPYALGTSGQTYNCIPHPGRHNGGNNVGFADGHAKWIATQTMLDRNWSGWQSAPASIQ